MTLCREKLREAGLPYPKSSCQKCGSLIGHGWKCAEKTGEAESMNIGRVYETQRGTDPNNQFIYINKRLIGAVLNLDDGRITAVPLGNHTCMKFHKRRAAVAYLESLAMETLGDENGNL